MKIKQILNWLNENDVRYSFIGDENTELVGFSSLKNYKKDTLTWIKKKENYSNQSIRCCVSSEQIDGVIDNQIIVENSKKVFFSILDALFVEKRELCPIGTNTVIGDEVVLGENVHIGSNCTIEGKIKIGDNTTIGNGVVIVNNVEIGSGCEIQSLTVIGEDGFGYSEENNIKTMVKHYGGVTIGDDVFIGSHVNIARGTIDNTIIENGVKIAPSTHIGHNNIIKKNAVVICSTIFGSVYTGENAYLSYCAVRNQCSIGDNTLVGMGAVVTGDIEQNKIAVGIPAKVIKDR